MYAVLLMKAYSTNHTCLSTRIKKRTSGFHCHGTDGAVDDLGARIPPTAVAARGNEDLLMIFQRRILLVGVLSDSSILYFCKCCLW